MLRNGLRWPDGDADRGDNFDFYTRKTEFVFVVFADHSRWEIIGAFTEFDQAYYHVQKLIKDGANKAFQIYAVEPAFIVTNPMDRRAAYDYKLWNYSKMAEQVKGLECSACHLGYAGCRCYPSPWPKDYLNEETEDAFTLGKE